MCCYIVNSSTSGFRRDFAMHQSFIRMVNQHPRSQERLAAPRRGFRDTLHVLRKLPGELAYTFCGGSLPWSHVLSVMQLTPSFVAVWRSESLVSLVYRVNAWRTSSVLIAGV